VINWKASRTEHELIMAITRRALEMAKQHKIGHLDAMTVNMDITAAHLNGCPLQLEQLLHAEDFDFAHDVFGIEQHINRENGQLEDCFVPRYAVKEVSGAVM